MIIPQYIYGSNEELQRYFALLIQQMQLALSNNGWTVPQLTTAQIARVTQGISVPGVPYFQPVLPVGTIWFNTSIGKLQVLVTAAVPEVSNGVIETITSV